VAARDRGGLPSAQRRRARGETMTAVIEAQGLKKRYGKTQALDGLDLIAESGQVVAVLGPNGAGKTTFVRAVATLLRPDRERYEWQATTSSGDRPRFGGSSGWPASSPPSNPR